MEGSSMGSSSSQVMGGETNDMHSLTDLFGPLTFLLYVVWKSVLPLQIFMTLSLFYVFATSESYDEAVLSFIYPFSYIILTSFPIPPAVANAGFTLSRFNLFLLLATHIVALLLGLSLNVVLLFEDDLRDSSDHISKIVLYSNLVLLNLKLVKLIYVICTDAITGRNVIVCYFIREYFCFSGHFVSTSDTDFLVTDSQIRVEPNGHGYVKYVKVFR
eukprot:CAMPEP_0119132032 /NCGR_PEP_ID=MMETSP1310-20130426/11215_1 /TAXON_ID=464262 /ORGANISM="Genus nov. species nov., Strain RCC2339" /LENGTH=215 /DNA_ID=CAMNT_0007122641 /DNA_START=50 /DNA_END=697 /DNA_ORIENTATION=+